jgi:hypothetical protein
VSASAGRSAPSRWSPALPPNLDLDRALAAHHGHIVDEQPEHPLPLAHRGAGIMPHPRQIGHQGLNARAILGGELDAVRRGRTAVRRLDLGQPHQLGIPLLLEGVGDQPVFGPDQHELALSQPRLLARALDVGASQPIRV